MFLMLCLFPEGLSAFRLCLVSMSIFFVPYRKISTYTRTKKFLAVDNQFQTTGMTMGSSKIITLKYFLHILYKHVRFVPLNQVSWRKPDVPWIAERMRKCTFLCDFNKRVRVGNDLTPFIRCLAYNWVYSVFLFAAEPWEPTRLLSTLYWRLWIFKCESKRKTALCFALASWNVGSLVISSAPKSSRFVVGLCVQHCNVRMSILLTNKIAHG